MKNLRTTLLAGAFIAANLMQGQSITRQVLAEGGTTALSGDIILCWTMGQPGPVETAIAPDFVITQGFQQGDESLVGISEELWADNKLKIYPNPSKGIFKLEGYLLATETIRYGIYDNHASLLTKGKITVSADRYFSHEFNLSGSPPGIYLFRLTTSSDELSAQTEHSFKIILIP